VDILSELVVDTATPRFSSPGVVSCVNLNSVNNFRCTNSNLFTRF